MMPTVLNGVEAERTKEEEEEEEEMSARMKRRTCGKDNARDFTGCCADINGWYSDFPLSLSAAVPHTLIVKQALFY